jgi:hypothetical protein
MNLNIIFACFLVTPVGKRDHSAVPRLSVFAAGREAIWNQGLALLATAFSYDVAQSANLFRDYLDDPRDFGSVKDLCLNYPRCVSVAGRQLGSRPFVDIVKRIEGFPAAEGACERLFCQFPNLVGDFRHQMSEYMIVDLVVIKAIIIWPGAAHIKECGEGISEVRSDT